MAVNQKHRTGEVAPDTQTGGVDQSVDRQPVAPSAPVANGVQTPVKESKKAKFYRLATARLPKALDRLSQLAALGNRSQYEMTDAQRDYVLKKLMVAMDAVTASYMGKVAAKSVDSIPE